MQGGADAAALSAAADSTSPTRQQRRRQPTHTADACAIGNAAANGYANDDDGTRKPGTSTVTALLYPMNFSTGSKKDT